MIDLRFFEILAIILVKTWITIICLFSIMLIDRAVWRENKFVFWLASIPILCLLAAVWIFVWAI